jgi:hypothetical protein
VVRTISQVPFSKCGVVPAHPPGLATGSHGTQFGASILNVTDVPSATFCPPLVTLAATTTAELTTASVGDAVNEMENAVGVGDAGGDVGLSEEQPASVSSAPSTMTVSMEFRFMVVSRISRLKASHRRS